LLHERNGTQPVESSAYMQLQKFNVEQLREKVCRLNNGGKISQCIAYAEQGTYTCSEAKMWVYRGGKGLYHDGHNHDGHNHDGHKVDHDDHSNENVKN